VNAYLDASVVLRAVFGEPNQLEEWDAITSACCSVLARVECSRTLDRIRLGRAGSDEAMWSRLPVIHRIFEGIQTVELSPAILTRASQPLPTPLGTLDSLHLASALTWREQNPEDDLVFATHDRALGHAARIMGLTVIGTD
jgi:predicted nucleic acid-binding protein